MADKNMGFIEQLRKRGMVRSTTSNIDELFDSNGMVRGYLGIDPTAPSLHVGHLVAIMLLRQFQLAGHKPYVLIGGATGMIGDPSFKATERKFLEVEEIEYNQQCLHNQLSKYLDFSVGLPNKAEIVNNKDWYSNMSVISFLRDAGKYITVNYMSSKESVRRRIIDGISFTEFSYQIMQGYDFYHLYREYGIVLQMGGDDQWGNLTTGVELIRKKLNENVHALTIPLLLRTDGTKFGKSEGNNVWLDPKMTSPYQFYQFWINCSDEEVKRFVNIFTLLPTEEINKLIIKHDEAPEKRLLQKRIAQEITTFIHGEGEYNIVKLTSDVLFGKITTFDELLQINEEKLALVFAKIPQIIIHERVDGCNVLNVLSYACGDGLLFNSKGDLRRAVAEGSVVINKVKVHDPYEVLSDCMLHDKYVLLQRGSKKYLVLVLK